MTTNPSVTIGPPTPAPQMPVMYAVASPCGDTHCGWSMMPWGTLKDAAIADHKAHPGSRLITIDPDAPSFTPGPLEWVESDGCGYRVEVLPRPYGHHGRYIKLPDTIPCTTSAIDDTIRALLTVRAGLPEGGA